MATATAYEVRVLDAAGNVGSRTLRAVAGPRLIAPAAGAVVKGRKPPVLRWTPIRGASYYNVQLFRNGHKVMSAWPTQRAAPSSSAAWRFTAAACASRQASTSGWCGRDEGARSKADYGERIGVRKFTVP